MGFPNEIHRAEPVTFNPDRKDHHWGKRKLERDSIRIAIRLICFQNIPTPIVRNIMKSTATFSKNVSEI